jgi:hypothetical protein
MDVESLAKQLILQNMTPEQQTAVLDSIRASVTQAKDVQKQRIGENVKVVVEALKKIEADIKSRYDETGKVIEKRVASIKDGKDGRNGVDGKAGRDGRSGADGATGPRGADGLNGRDGRDGEDGVSVTDAHIDFDGSLIIHLSTGRVINVGEVVAPDLVEKIKVITNGGGTSQQVLDTLASLQTQINNLIPSQTGNAGKYLTTNGTVVSWSSVAGGLSYQGTWNATTNTPTLASGVGTNGYYYITATAGSTNLDGITDWQIGDWLMFNGTVWQKIDQSNLVTSVAGRTGAITLTTADVGGLGTIATQAANNVSITGGSITGITDLAVADGGTGASNASDARTNLGLVIGTDVLSPTGSAASLTSFPTFNQNTTGTASNVTGTVAIANGGTGETTRQAAMDALAGAVTSGSYLRGNGTDVVMNTIQAADVPTLNQNTTGTASNVTGTVAIANGGTGATTAASALSNLGAVAKAGDTMTGALGFVAGSASTPSLFASGDTNTGIFFPAADTIAFAEGGAEAMRITSAGKFCVATTGFTSGAQGYIEVEGNTAEVRNLFASNNTAAGSGSVGFFAFKRNGTFTGGISQTDAATSYNTSSDYRLKENVEPMTGALAKVLQLKPCTYTWKASGLASQGFIAHELSEVCPEAVFGEKDAVYEDGSIKPQGIDVSFLVATLTAAIQEQQVLITQLQADVAALKASA